jgi:tRNA modification GTPase
LPFAQTIRTAAILLDQAHGAYDRAITAGGTDHELLRRNARIGRHLVEPWTIAIAGAPNAGKSTLLNALAGFTRSVVSPLPGTTRDAVSVSLAFDGWPVEVIDTAGLRESPDAIEQEGVARAKDALATSDLCLCVVDATGSRPDSIGEVVKMLGRNAESILVVFNKCDLISIPDLELPEAIRISAATGQGLAELVSQIVSMLVPGPPRPGAPVPFTPELCDRWS